MSDLSEEQRLMRQSCRDFVDDVVAPFIRSSWQREWDMNPQARLPPVFLYAAWPGRMEPPAKTRALIDLAKLRLRGRLAV